MFDPVISDSFKLAKLVIQPTSRCNLNCEYCYLANRDKSRKFSVQAAENLAAELARIPSDKLEQPITLIWHGGEPLACGYRHFNKLVNPFRPLVEKGIVMHSIQTNATLVNDHWCDFFIENQFQVGVSLDGSRAATTRRVDWNGEEAYDRIMAGIAHLNNRNIPFSVIAVVSQESLDDVDNIPNFAEELYSFFLETGTVYLGINIEEKENVNDSRAIPDGESVKIFWRELHSVWAKNPTLRMREFAGIIPWMAYIAEQSAEDVETINHKIDMFPSISWNGDVVLLSPEFLGSIAPKYNNFVVGNIGERSLRDILVSATEDPYVTEFLEGVAQCKAECPFFSVCGGGQASNKYFELNDLTSTETSFCRSHTKNLFEGILSSMES